MLRRASVLGLALLLGWCAYAADKALAPESVLPKPSFMAGWTAQGEPAVYGKDNLFEYIDGEAELFYPYGFERLASMAYQNAADPDVGLTADVYVLGTLLDAFGVYTSLKPTGGKPLDVGAEGAWVASQAAFYQGRYFVMLQVTGGLELDSAVYTACAKAIAARLPGGKVRPAEMKLLAIPQAVPGTEKYFPANFLAYSFMPPVLVVEVGTGEKPPRAFVGLCKDPAEAAKVLDAYRAELTKMSVTPEAQREGAPPRVAAMTSLYQGLVLEQEGRYVLGVVGVSDLAKTEAIAALRARVTAK